MTSTPHKNIITVSAVIVLGVICGAMIAGMRGAVIAGLLATGLQFAGRGHAWISTNLRHRTHFFRSVWAFLTTIAQMLFVPVLWVACVPLVLGVMLVRWTQAGAQTLRSTDGTPTSKAARTPSANRRWSPGKWIRALIGNPAYFIINLIQLIVLGCLLIGIEVALYAALLLVPAILVLLVLLAIDGGHRHQPEG